MADRPPTHISEALEALQSEYGEAPVERESPPFEAPPALFERFVQRAEAGALHSSYVWVRRRPDQFPPRGSSESRDDADGTERVLLVYDRADDHEWSAPGGAREPGESFTETARRELAEETGIEATIVGLRKIRHQVAVPADPVGGVDVDEVHALHPLFDAEYAGGDLDVQDAELYGAAWFDHLPEHAHERVADQTIGGE